MKEIYGKNYVKQKLVLNSKLKFSFKNTETSETYKLVKLFALEVHNTIRLIPRFNIAKLSSVFLSETRISETVSPYLKQYSCQRQI